MDWSANVHNQHSGMKEVATPVNTDLKLMKAQEKDELCDETMFRSAVGSCSIFQQ